MIRAGGAGQRQLVVAEGVQARCPAVLPHHAEQHRGPSSPSPGGSGASAEPSPPIAANGSSSALLPARRAEPEGPGRGAGERSSSGRSSSRIGGPHWVRFSGSSRTGIGADGDDPCTCSSATLASCSTAMRSAGSSSVRSVPGWRSIPPVERPRPAAPDPEPPASIDDSPWRNAPMSPKDMSAPPRSRRGRPPGRACRRRTACRRPNGDPDGDPLPASGPSSSGSSSNGSGGPSSVTLRCYDSATGAPSRRGASARRSAVATSSTVAAGNSWAAPWSPATTRPTKRPRRSNAAVGPGRSTPGHEGAGGGCPGGDDRIVGRCPVCSSAGPQPPDQAHRRSDSPTRRAPAARRRRRTPDLPAVTGRPAGSPRRDDRQVQTVVVRPRRGPPGGRHAVAARPDLWAPLTEPDRTATWTSASSTTPVTVRRLWLSRTVSDANVAGDVVGRDDATVPGSRSARPRDDQTERQQAEAPSTSVEANQVPRRRSGTRTCLQAPARWGAPNVWRSLNGAASEPSACARPVPAWSRRYRSSTRRRLRMGVRASNFPTMTPCR